MAEAGKSESSTFLGSAQTVVSEDEGGSGIVGFAAAEESRPEEDKEAVCARSAVRLVQVLEGDIERDGAVFTGPLYVQKSFPSAEGANFKSNPATRAVYIRARLAYLTGDSFQPPGAQWDPELQGVARRLQTALQDAAGYIFREAPLREASWKRVKALTWSAACDFTFDSGTGPKHLLTAAFPLHFLMRQQGRRWLIDEYQLAAVMGLWRYAISRRAGPANAPGFGTRRHRMRKFIQAAGSSERTAAVVRLWVTKDGPLEHKYEAFPVQQVAGTLTLSVDASLRALQGNPRSRWDIPSELPLRFAIAEEDRTDRRGVSLLSVQTTASLLEMMAQDIFTTFMFEVISIMDNLRDISIRQQPGSSGESILRNPNAASSEIGNEHIDALARILCESGLASEEAALMCIVPAFFHHSKLPTLDESIAPLLDRAKTLRSDGQYQQGEAHLRSLLKICSPDQHEKVARALGELCRDASRSPRAMHRDFGLRAMTSLGLLFTQGGTALSQEAVTALEDYLQLCEFLKADPRHSAREATPQPALDMASVAELRQDIDLPRDKRSRLKALLMLEKYDIRDRYSLAVHELLFVSIKLGYTEVIEDLRFFNPSLLFGPPSSEVPPGEDEPLTVVVQRKFNAGGRPEHPDPNGKESRTYLKSGARIAFFATAWAASQLEHAGRVPGEAEDVLRTLLGWARIDDLTDGQKNTPLMYAASTGNLAAVDVLLEYGVDFRGRNIEGETVLSKAVASNCFPVVERILKEGERTGGLPHSHLHHALALALRSRKRDVIELLLRHGADINERDEWGKTLLLAAMEPSRAAAEVLEHQPHTIKSLDGRRAEG
jgi:hypothetical protein